MYTRSTDEDERELAMGLEAAAVAAAAEVVTLSRADADYVAKELTVDGKRTVPKVCRSCMPSDVRKLHHSRFVQRGCSKHLPETGRRTGRHAHPGTHALVFSPAQVLLPALRDDMARLPLPDDFAGAAGIALTNGAASGPLSGAAAGHAGEQCVPELTGKTDAEHTRHGSSEQPAGLRRRYLTCCVRLSPEKEPHRFVELVEFLAGCVAAGTIICSG